MSKRADSKRTRASFEDVRARFELTPIRDCPGRFIIQGAASATPEAVAGGPVTVRRFAGRSRDPVVIAPLTDGGIISYEKPDGSFVHTLCNRDGYRRKIEQLGIPAAEASPAKDE